MFEMLFKVTICVLLCQAFNAAAQQYQAKISQNVNNLEATPDINEIDAENELQESILYRPVTLEEGYRVTRKQAQCLKVASQKTISHASVLAPLSNSKRHTNLKVICIRQQKPILWYGQSKYEDADFDEKTQSMKHEDDSTAIISLQTIKETFSFELPGCNVCVEKNHADPNYVNVFMAQNNPGETIPTGSQNGNLQEPFYREKRSRAKRAASKVKLSFSSQKKNVGDSLTVACDGPSKNITWKDALNKEIKSNVKSDPYVSTSFKKSHNISTLVFRSIDVKHQGNYTCVVGQNGKNESAVFTLSVTVPPVKPKAKMTPSTSKVTLELGSDYTVVCSGNSRNTSWRSTQGPYSYILAQPGYPGTSYVYSTANLNTNETTLYFKNVTTWQAGEYHCAVNRSGTEDIQKLTISVKNPVLQFSPDDKDSITVKENKDYDITCEGSLNSIKWIYNNIEISKNKKDDIFQKDEEMKNGVMKRKLKFDDVQKAYEGKYTCSGTLAFNGSKIERSFQLKVDLDNNLNTPRLYLDDNKLTDSNIYLKVNDSLEVICRGETDELGWSGAPHGWKIPENTPESSPIRLERIKRKKLAIKFKKVNVSNEGTYTCDVSKRQITKTKGFRLYVIDPTYFIGSSLSPTVNEFSNVTLECSAGGHPKPIVNWYYRGNYVDDNEPNAKLIDGRNNARYEFINDNLLIKNITYKEAGRYACVAKQDIEKGMTRERAISVYVHHKPYPLSNHTFLEGRFNSTITVVCEMLSDPPASYTWYKLTDGFYKPETLALNTPNLKIELINESRFGEYICKAVNPFGYAEKYITLIQMEPPRAPQIEVTKISTTFIYLKAIAERNSSFTHYNIEYRGKDTNEWNEVNVTIGKTWDSEYELTDLFENTPYVLRVRSINDLGLSLPSNEIAFTTIATVKAFGIRLTSSLTILFAVFLNWIL